MQNAISPQSQKLSQTKVWWIIVSIILVVIVLIFSIDNSADPGDHKFRLKHDGFTRKYLVHVPIGYTETSPVPVMIVMHGGGSSSKTVAKFTDMNTKSDAEGFIVVYPQSEKSSNGYNHWNNGPRPLEPYKEGIADDVGFLNLMLDEMAANYNIDSKRVYAAGISSGGMMAYRIACDMSDRIAAVASVAGTLLMDNCQPTKPISVLHIHGRQDKLIRFNGGPTDPSIPEFFKRTVPLRSVQESLDVFINDYACLTPPLLTYQSGQAKCHTYSGCTADSEIELCTIDDGGHTWPGGPSSPDHERYFDLVGKLSYDLNANDTIWSFFAKHSLQ